MPALFACGDARVGLVAAAAADRHGDAEERGELEVGRELEHVRAADDRVDEREPCFRGYALRSHRAIWRPVADDAEAQQRREIGVSLYEPSNMLATVKPPLSDTGFS